MCPVVPISAFTHRQSDEPIEIDGKQFPYFRGIGAYTTIFNLAGNPVVVLPLTQSQDGLTTHWDAGGGETGRSMNNKINSWRVKFLQEFIMSIFGGGGRI